MREWDIAYCASMLRRSERKTLREEDVEGEKEGEGRRRRREETQVLHGRAGQIAEVISRQGLVRRVENVVRLNSFGLNNWCGHSAPRFRPLPLASSRIACRRERKKKAGQRRGPSSGVAEVTSKSENHVNHSLLISVVENYSCACTKPFLL